MKKRMEQWTLTDRFVFAGCYGLLGLFFGFLIALSMAKYLDTGFSSSMIVLVISLTCTLMGFFAPDTASRCLNRLWLWFKYW
ncbi:MULTISPECIES: hypothetical protein [Acinetobacter]|uniref:MFS transporter n=1 Tax=Acinetobacter septicus TaxID=465797 RepID=A0ABD7F4Y6_9GAMM|nr:MULTISPECIES: hypothetical protein [Acinetobacter]QXZ23115.1 hypothetical protein I6L31_15825 [Acinetobacter septicus]